MVTKALQVSNMSETSTSVKGGLGNITCRGVLLGLYCVVKREDETSFFPLWYATMISRALNRQFGISIHGVQPARLYSPTTRSATHRTYHQLRAQQQQQQSLQQPSTIPLLHHSTRARFFSHAAAMPAMQVRSIGFSSIPRMTISVLRLPTLLAGTTVAGVTLANNKISGNIS